MIAASLIYRVPLLWWGLSKHLTVVLIDLLAGFVRRLEGGGGHRLEDGGIGLLVELRDEDVDVHQQGHLAVAVDRRESLATQTEDLAWLRACSDVHARLPTDRRYLDGATSGGRRYGDEEVVDEVIAVADEVGILFFLDDDLQVTGDTTAGGCVPLALDGDCMPSATPAGMRKDTTSSPICVPFPLQKLQGLVMTSPVPHRWGQTDCVCIMPKILR